MTPLRHLTRNGGVITADDDGQQLVIQPVETGYTVAQLDDYGGAAGGLRHHPGVALSLRARIMLPDVASPAGTAGFGFWNAPFADADIQRITLPQAAWFFFAAPPNYLPFPPDGPAHGWFAGTVNAQSWQALSVAPLAPLLLLLNQSRTLRRRLWPWLRGRLGITYTDLSSLASSWHAYRLEWRRSGCAFFVDGRLVQFSPRAPRGPLGFVCWTDNQYMILSPQGRIGAGTTPVRGSQTLAIRDLVVTQIE